MNKGWGRGSPARDGRSSGAADTGDLKMKYLKVKRPESESLDTGDMKVKYLRQVKVRKP